MSETPNTPDTPNTSGTPKKPDTNIPSGRKTPSTAKTPNTSGTPDTAGASKAPGSPSTSRAPRPRRNRLAKETSPYLLQHAGNPVDWYPWGDEAFEKARSQDRPIFLSIGYSSCHWCHVMEHESFENDQIAAYLNEHFVPVKVDREERPDVDEIYMAAVQMLSGQGGWPLSAFLTPDLKPFFGGTYFPPDDRLGRAGFRRILESVRDAYHARRGDVDSTADEVARRLASLSESIAGKGLLSTSVLKTGAESLMRSFDETYGGFGHAPKFPHSMGIQLLLRHSRRHGDLEALRMARKSLDQMAAGGIYDHLAGGFHRYSTDERWLVPHFEKMLYDQALIVLAYVEAWQVTGSIKYDRVVRQTLDYVLREMTSPEGAFYSSQDADTEGEEGKFFLWTPAEVAEVLGEEHAKIFGRAYDVDEVGNFEGRSILHPVASEEGIAAMTGHTPEEVARILADAREALLQVREKRTRPARDEKVLVSWNALMASALARAGQALEEPRYTEAAKRACAFILQRVRDGNGLLHVYAQGKADVPAFLEDYANLIAAAIDIYEADFHERWLPEAKRLASEMIARFADEESGGFFNTSPEHSHLLVRPKNAQDGSTPSGNSMAAYALLRLGRLTGDTDLEQRAAGTLAAFQGLLERAPGAFHWMLIALDLHLGPRQEIVVAGPPTDRRTGALLAAARRAFLPHAVLAWTDGTGAGQGDGGSLLRGKVMVGGEPAAYVCRDFTCDAPVTTTEELEEALLGATTT